MASQYLSGRIKFGATLVNQLWGNKWNEFDFGKEIVDVYILSDLDASKN